MIDETYSRQAAFRVLALLVKPVFADKILEVRVNSTALPHVVLVRYRIKNTDCCTFVSKKSFLAFALSKPDLLRLKRVAEEKLLAVRTGINLFDVFNQSKDRVYKGLRLRADSCQCPCKDSTDNKVAWCKHGIACIISLGFADHVHYVARVSYERSILRVAAGKQISNKRVIRFSQSA